MQTWVRAWAKRTRLPYPTRAAGCSLVQRHGWIKMGEVLCVCCPHLRPDAVRPNERLQEHAAAAKRGGLLDG